MGTRFNFADVNRALFFKALPLIPLLLLTACEKTEPSDEGSNVFDAAADSDAVCEENNIPEELCVLDCSRELGGRAAIDECGRCVGGRTGLVSCRCGDGEVDAAEGCDDGDTISNGEGACLADCSRNQICGDGAKEGTERCDDGDTISNGQGECLADCSGRQSCGNGSAEGTEGCDDGDDNGNGVGYCKIDCSGIEPPSGMVAVPAGEFTYGSGEIRTTEAFYIDIHEVTAGEYKACVDANKCDYNGSTSSSYRTWNNSKDNHPINYVNWNEAVAYCTWKGKRLPTEVEWEKAARGTDGRTYPWGNQTARCDYAVMLEGGGGCGTDSVWPVGSKENGKSPYGAYDMAGNLWEWTNSLWSPTSNYRVLRGGSFLGVEFNLRSSYRYSFALSGRYTSFGFRCSQ